MSQKVRWCVPQPILDVANDVHWPKVKPERIPSLVAQLRSLITTYTHLSTLKNDPPIPATAPKLHVREDVPQQVLNVFNALDFTRTSSAEAWALADQLRSVVFLPVIGLPKRKG